MRALFPAAVIVAASLSACGMLKVDPEADVKARALYEQIRTGGDLAANADLAPDLKTPATVAQLSALRAQLPPGAPTAVANRSWSINSTNGQTTASLVHAYSYPSTTVLTETVLAKGRDKAWTITGFHVKFGDAAGPPAKPSAVSVESQPKDI